MLPRVFWRLFLLGSHVVLSASDKVRTSGWKSCIRRVFRGFYFCWREIKSYWDYSYLHVAHLIFVNASGPPGSRSGFISQRYGSGSGSFYHQAKKSRNRKNRKTFTPTALWLLFDFLSLINDKNVPSKIYKQKNFFLISFLLVSWRSMTKIAGSQSGSISQRHGSADPDPDPH